MTNSSPRRGRRPGRPETRQRILEIAANRFQLEGYAAVTMRSVAAEAGVDVALISYFFASKQGLLGAALALSANPAEVLAGALPGELDGLPERVLRAVVTTWDDASGIPLRIMVRAAAHNPDIARLVREMSEREIVTTIADRLAGDDARQRAGLFAAQILGLIFTRYVLELDPIATMPADELVRRLSPALRGVLRPARTH